MSYIPAIECNVREFIAFTGAGMLENGKSVFVGTGLPMIAGILAQKTHAPNLLIIFEAGGVGPILPELPISVGQSLTCHRGVAASSMHDVMASCQAGFIDYGFLGGAQIDMYGNINTTCIGDHNLPKVRLPGSGGANDIASFANKTIIIAASQSKRTFVNKLDFLTSPGYLDGPGAREKAGLPLSTGPYRVITQLATYGFDENTKQMKLISLHPGVSLEEVQDNCSFDMLIPEKYTISPEPSEKDLHILRKEIDPTGIMIGK
ncbi:MAG: 3-oxoacid CoA-transferase [Dehalococcoidia bacterium]|nr:3-oxoacid CoA-transferase [Dehalococcoidia bacterium]MDD5493485.1 3-oxoacid CoA-transferase [Dehalococcoidia bacterium]